MEDMITRRNVLFGNVRGSGPYWKRQTARIMAMVVAFGPPTLFMTLSAADVFWDDLEKYLLQ